MGTVLVTVHSVLSYVALPLGIICSVAGLTVGDDMRKNKKAPGGVPLTQFIYVHSAGLTVVGAMCLAWAGTLTTGTLTTPWVCALGSGVLTFLQSVELRKRGAVNASALDWIVQSSLRRQSNALAIGAVAQMATFVSCGGIQLVAVLVTELIGDPVSAFKALGWSGWLGIIVGVPCMYLQYKAERVVRNTRAMAGSSLAVDPDPDLPTSTYSNSSNSATANAFSALLLFISGTKMAGAFSLGMCVVALVSHKRLHALNSNTNNEMASSGVLFLGSMAQALSAFMIFKPSIIPFIVSIPSLAWAAHPGSILSGVILAQIIEGLAAPLPGCK